MQHVYILQLKVAVTMYCRILHPHFFLEDSQQRGQIQSPLGNKVRGGVKHAMC